jgi:hypothetical protein
MKLDPKTTFTPDPSHDILADPVLCFVAAHHEGLWHAARLLGGYESARLVDRCISLLVENGCVTPRTRIMLDQILTVLALDLVHDPDQPYMGFFAAIDPLDPVVEEICLLTDSLRHALARADAEPGLRNAA